MKKTSHATEPVAPTCNVITRNQTKRLWALFYSADSIKKLLDRSERLHECECEAGMLSGHRGAKGHRQRYAGEVERLLYEIENNPTASWPDEYMNQTIEMELKEGGAQ